MAENIFNTLFGKKKTEAKPVLVELHNHFLPGIDDGVRTVEESIELLTTFSNLGYKKVIMTPHIMQGAYDNNAQTIGDALNLVKNALKTTGLSIQVEAAAEYFFDDYFINLVETEQPLMNFNKKYVLFELPTVNRPKQLEEVIFRLKLLGYLPVIAHPERYPLFHEKSFEKYQALKDLDCYFQLNLMSFTGHYGKQIQAVAEDLSLRGMVDFVGSDIHGVKHLPMAYSAWNNENYKALTRQPTLLNNSLLD